MDVEIGATKEGKRDGAQGLDDADHGAFDAAADPRKYPAGLFGIVTGSYDFPNAFAELDAYFTNKAPGGIAYRCSFRVTEASYAIERGMDILAHRLGMDPGRTAQAQLHQEGAVPVPVAARLRVRQRRLSPTLRKALDIVDYTGAAQRASGEARARRADGDRHLDLHRSRRRGTGKALRHHGHQDVRQRRDPHSSDRFGHRARRNARARAKATRRPGRRSSPKSSASIRKT